MRLSVKVALITALAGAAPLIISSILISNSYSGAERQFATRRMEAQSLAAKTIYDQRLFEVRSAVQAVADLIGSANLLDSASLAASRARLQDLLTRARDEYSLDFLVVADATGKVVARHNDIPAAGEMIGDIAKSNPVQARAFEAGSHLQSTSSSASVIETGNFLSRLWLDKAAHVEGSDVQAALMIEGGAPILSSGRFAGTLLVGQMVNNYYVARQGANSIQTPVVTEARDKVVATAGGGVLVALGNSVIASSITESAGTSPVLKGAKCNPDSSFQTLKSGGKEYAISWQKIKTLDSSGGAQIAAVGAALPAQAAFGSGVGVQLALLFAILLDLLMGAASGFLFGRLVSARIGDLNESVRRMSVGDLGTPVSEKEPVEEMASTGWKGKLGSFLRRLDEGDEIASLGARLEHLRESFRQAIERQRKR